MGWAIARHRQVLRPTLLQHSSYYWCGRPVVNKQTEKAGAREPGSCSQGLKEVNCYNHG